ncbi:peptidoglycan-binding protein [uncultured Maritimibacter sp.]|jgi:uncharacterized protein (TIGR02594 family)|uniref:peptidoglycan-binding protein n=1 Tax=uncultured Maritimibacter sp. TaxID=991866 RepID=UPI002625253C|nr:peptidoglycan-binding protein [uncultured Maritimibacter sp.]
MAIMSVIEAQELLARGGFDPGPLDGIIGRKTQAALRAFQVARGLRVTGVLDGATVRALAGDPAAQARLPWMIEAGRVMGLHEARDKARLWAWLKSDGATVGDPARVPWCGDFVQTAFALSLPDEPLPGNPYLAASWAGFGIECAPQYGAVLSFWRGSPSSWQGHVGFYAGEDAGRFLVMGGNQSNAVTVSPIDKRRLRAGGCRWPASYRDPKAGAHRVDLGGMITSQNEA